MNRIRVAMDSSQAWIILVCTGVSVGIVAAAIDTVSDWLGDLKEGFCQATFYLNRGFCCWGIQGTRSHERLEINSRARILFRLVYLGHGFTCIFWRRRISCIIYFLCSFSGTFIPRRRLMQVVFAGAASLLVVSYAPYAKHSGIPEIKTMLGGFVIRRYIGTWVLLIKSLGLVTILHDELLTKSVLPLLRDYGLVKKVL